MVESKNLKLKLGLCGLALTSFLALNARDNTVHADTVNSGNANAITWDADNDDSQVVQSSVQKQNAPVTQSVQSNVQSKKQQIAVSNVSSTPVQAKRAEMGLVRQSNTQTSTVNRLNANVARNNQVKVANVHATADQHVQISNPQNNQVIVHYVKSNGQSAGLADQTIDLSNIKYNTTAVNKGGYLQLRKPYDKITDPNGNDLLSDNADKNIGVPLKTSSANKLANVFNTNDKGNVQVSGADNVAIISIGNKTSMDNPIDNVGGKYLVSIKSIDHYYMFTSNSVNNVTANDIVSNYIDTGGIITDEVGSANQLTKQECADLENWVIKQDLVSINTKTVPVLKIYKDNIINSKIGMGKYNAPSGYNLVKSDGSYKVSSTDNGHSYTFNDGGSATSSVGNHINVPVTKPQNVDPNSAQCKKQATRVIHIAFPNGVKPESYDSITDSAGNKLTLDSNNDLTQTVTFTRSVTVDGLTGATLNQTPWQQHGVINAVTLPAIPGYTMTQTK